MTTISLRRRIHWSLWAVPLGVLAIGAAIHGIMMLVPPPDGLDMSRTKASANGSFVATVEPQGPIAVRQPLTWTVTVAMADGSAVSADQVSVDGWMPHHAHGLPSEPQVAKDLGGGKFSVEGLTFSMAGWWEVNVHVDTPNGDDKATFNFAL